MQSITSHPQTWGKKNPILNNIRIPGFFLDFTMFESNTFPPKKFEFQTAI